MRELHHGFQRLTGSQRDEDGTIWGHVPAASDVWKIVREIRTTHVPWLWRRPEDETSQTPSRSTAGRYCTVRRSRWTGHVLYLRTVTRHATAWRMTIAAVCNLDTTGGPASAQLTSAKQPTLSATLAGDRRGIPSVDRFQRRLQARLRPR